MEQDEKIEMTSAVEVMNKLYSKGYKENFTIKDKHLQGGGQKFKPDEVKVKNYYRFEGISDPADNSIVYAIETNNGMKGVLTDAFGPYSDSSVTSFMNEVEDLSKKTDRGGPDNEKIKIEELF